MTVPLAPSADDDVTHECWLAALVVPRVAGALLDDQGAGGEFDFLAVVELEVKFTFETDAVVDAVGGVHAGVVPGNAAMVVGSAGLSVTNTEVPSASRPVTTRRGSIVIASCSFAVRITGRR
jgi:hypothetical protein